MAVTVRIPTQLRELAGGAAELQLAGGTVAEVLAALEAEHQGFGERLFDDRGKLRRFVNVFVAEEDIRFLDGVDTPVADGQVLSILPAVAGGADMHDSTEEYLETILEIEEEGIVPIRARIVERLGLSAAAVSEQVNRLVEQGYAELLGDRTLKLTEKGRDLAVSILRRHRLAERLLVDVIGLPWEKAHREADRWEHAISAEVEERLVELLGDPATCPHGNPIPGTHRSGDGRVTVTLTNAPLGRVTVARVSERLELDDDALRQVADAGLIPGSAASVVRSEAGVVIMATDTGERRVPNGLADLLFVVPG